MSEEPADIAPRYACPWCGRLIVTTIDGRYRVHGPRSEPCDGSGMTVPDTLAHTRIPPVREGAR